MHLWGKDMRLVFAVLIMCLLCADVLAEGEIEFTRVPEYGSTSRLRGRVWGVRYGQYRVAVFIYVNGWWTKPYWRRPEVLIRSTGKWSCNIATSETDRYATEIIAFLVPRRYNTPLADGDLYLDSELYDFPYAKVNRDPTYRRIDFAGYGWWVLQSDWPIGAGPNFYADIPSHVYTDPDGYLHLNIAQIDSDYYCSEVVCEDSLGYGKYVYTVSSGVESLDENIVLGLFTWEDDVPQYNYREIDIEFSRWGNPVNDCGQFVVQPWDTPGNMYRFDLNSPGTTTHEITWQPQEVNFVSYYGQYTQNPAPQDIIASWSYNGDDIPPVGGENPRINFWLVSGQPPVDGQDAEIVIEDFQFIPDLTLVVDKYKVRTGRKEGQDSICLSGNLGKLNTAILERADTIQLTIDSDGLAEPYVVDMPVTRRSIRNGKYTHRDRTNKFKLDIAERQFSFSAKKADLTGLDCPITISIELANCYAETTFCD